MKMTKTTARALRSLCPWATYDRLYKMSLSGFPAWKDETMRIELSLVSASVDPDAIGRITAEMTNAAHFVKMFNCLNFTADGEGDDEMIEKEMLAAYENDGWDGVFAMIIREACDGE